MLYVSTRSKADSYTAHRALYALNAPDGGLFVPFHLPYFDADEIVQLRSQSFSEVVAHVLNLFFSQRLNAWDVEFSVGRYPVRNVSVGQKVSFAELWHNNGKSYRYFVEKLYMKLTNDAADVIPQWVEIAIAVSLLFGLFAELNKEGIDCADIAITDSTFVIQMAAWYARRMGLPVGQIICGCEENDGIWNMVRRGEGTPGCSGCLERLIYETSGVACALEFADSVSNNRTYRTTEEGSTLISEGFFAAVIGNDRTQSVVSSLQRTSAYTADVNAASSYGAVQDYRANTGENHSTIVLSLCGPGTKE